MSYDACLVILNAVKNLAVSADSHPLGDLEILRFAQDDNQWLATKMPSTVILNEVKNLSVSTDVGTLICHSERSEESLGKCGLSPSRRP